MKLCVLHIIQTAFQSGKDNDSKEIVDYIRLYFWGSDFMLDVIAEKIASMIIYYLSMSILGCIIYEIVLLIIVNRLHRINLYKMKLRMKKIQIL